MSRLGVTKEHFEEELLPLLDGLHIHTLCEQNSDDLAVTAKVFEDKFGKYLKGLKWVNFGGGHHITRADYDLAKLEEVVTHFKEAYGVQVYLEPGEAVVLNAGYLVSRVLEIVENGRQIAILDTSAACHMPDVLEMPYRPPVSGAGMPEEKPYFYRLAGPTCLAGDVMGDYSFDEPLTEGDFVIFEDMALYTMVKTNTFNGMRLPDLAIQRVDGTIEVIRRFGYEDFKERLS
jgi:carboxynorspermidine decarboxylase